MYGIAIELEGAIHRFWKLQVLFLEMIEFKELSKIWTKDECSS
jgi:hypothetical protein